MDTAPVSPAVPRFQQPRPALRWLCVLTALCGWYVSVQLVMVGFGGSSLFVDALCGDAPVGEDDCRSVLRSNWAYVLPRESALRLPVAALGAAYFAGIAVWFLLVGPTSRDRRVWHALALAIVVLGVWISLELTRAMAFELRRWCAGCVVAHLLNGLLLLFAVLAWPWRAAKAPTAHPSPRLAWAALLASIGVGGGQILYVLLLSASSVAQQVGAQYTAIIGDVEYVRWNHLRQPLVDIPPAQPQRIAGSAQATSRIVVFSDFQCPACARLHGFLEQLLREHADKVQIEFRHYPQDPTCNPNPRFAKGGHAAACRAARAAEAAFEVGGGRAYQAMRSRLFDGQRLLERDPFEAWAGEIGLDRAAFLAALQSPAIAERVAADVALGERLGVRALPAVFLNGRRLEGWSNENAWRALLELPAASQPASTEVNLAPE